MKRLFGFLFMASTLFAQELTWNHHMAEAIKLSKDSNKPIMMMYSAVWCGECDKMKNRVFQNPEINKMLKDDFILLSFDVEQDMERLPEGFSFRGVPTFFFIDSNKRLLKKAEGSSSKDSFISKLKSVKKRFK